MIVSAEPKKRERFPRRRSRAAHAVCEKSDVSRFDHCMPKTWSYHVINLQVTKIGHADHARYEVRMRFEGNAEQNCSLMATIVCIRYPGKDRAFVEGRHPPLLRLATHRTGILAGSSGRLEEAWLNGHDDHFHPNRHGHLYFLRYSQLPSRRVTQQTKISRLHSLTKIKSLPQLLWSIPGRQYPHATRLNDKALSLQTRKTSTSPLMRQVVAARLTELAN